jgi:sulfite exporter TauE/SafE
MTTHIFCISGLHCASCILLTESELTDLPYITHATTNLSKNTIEVTGEFGDKTLQTIANDLTQVLSKHGYTVSVEKRGQVGNREFSKNINDFHYALPIAALLIIIFIALQKAGLINLITASHVSYGTAFFIGIIASLSSCMAVVGGLVLAMEATFAKEGDKLRPQIMFHAGRLASFFLLGGVIGLLGTSFAFSITTTFIIGLIVGCVMLLLGLNLLDLFTFTKNLQPTIPKFISTRAFKLKNINHTLTPLLVGIITFILPCGFTQSMQLSALSSGSFLTGAFTMLAFALGTFPVLALISFSSFTIDNSRHKGVFFKTAGLIVIFFALFTLLNTLVAAGIIAPLFSF